MYFRCLSSRSSYLVTVYLAILDLVLPEHALMILVIYTGKIFIICIGNADRERVCNVKLMMHTYLSSSPPAGLLGNGKLSVGR